MTISEFAAISSVVAALAGALCSFLVLRVQRDVAQMKIDILEGVRGTYLSRNEHAIVVRQCHQWQQRIDAKIDETRERHHDLHEEFIACRAANGEG